MRGWLSASSVSCIKMAIGLSKTEPYEKNPNLRDGEFQHLKAGVKRTCLHFIFCSKYKIIVLCGKSIGLQSWHLGFCFFFSHYCNLKSFIFFGPSCLSVNWRIQGLPVSKYILYICINYIFLTSAWSSKKQESSRKTSILLYWLCQSLWLCGSQ